MDNCKILHSLLSQIHRNNQRLQAFKISSQQATQIFNILNSRRKGYLDLADIYSVFPNATEEQLFFLFKSLDLSRNNRIDLQDFIAVVSKVDRKSPQLSYGQKKKQHLMPKLQKILQVMISNFQSFQTKKKSLYINQESLRGLFFQIAGTKNLEEEFDQVQKSVQLETVINWMQEEWGFSKNLAAQMRNLFNSSKQTFTLSDFCQIFMPVSNFKSQKEIKDDHQFQKDKQRQLKVIGKIYQTNQDQILNKIKAKYGIKDQQEYKVSPGGIYSCNSSQSKTAKLYEPQSAAKNNLHSNSSKQNLHLIMKNLSKYQEQELQQRLHRNASLPDTQALNQRLLIKHMHEPLELINSKKYQIPINERQNRLLFERNNQIQRRRKQLQRGSLQRKKMLDEVLSRKKQDLIGHSDFPHQYLRQSLNNSNKTQNRYNQFVQSIKTPNQDCDLISRQKYHEMQYENMRPKSSKNSQGYIKDRHFDFPYQLYHNQINRILNRNKGQQYRTTFQSEDPAFGQVQSYRGPNFNQSYLKKSPLFELNSAQMIQQDYKRQFEFSRGKIKHGNSMSHSTLLKQNIMKRAEEEATKKIQQIERKARMKVIERKSSAGFKWKK